MSNIIEPTRELLFSKELNLLNDLVISIKLGNRYERLSMFDKQMIDSGFTKVRTALEYYYVEDKLKH